MIAIQHKKDYIYIYIYIKRIATSIRFSQQILGDWLLLVLI